MERAMAHLNLDLDYFEHRKTKRLIGRLGRGAEVLPIKLWRYCGKYHAEDGKLTGYTASEIESLAEWWGKSGEMMEAMVDVVFLEVIDGGWQIHDWIKMQGHIQALKDRAQHAANVRWDAIRNANGNSNGNANGMPGAFPHPSMPSKPIYKKSLSGSEKMKDRLRKHTEDTE
jgi:hypothetical protein